MDGGVGEEPLSPTPPLGAPALQRLKYEMEEATVRAGGVVKPTKAHCDADEHRIGTRSETFICTVSYSGKKAEFRTTVSVVSELLKAEPGETVPSGTEYHYKVSASATKLVLTREGVHRAWGYHPSRSDGDKYRCDAGIPEIAVMPPGPTPYRCYTVYRLGFKTRVAAYRVVLSTDGGDGVRPHGEISFDPIESPVSPSPASTR